MDKVVRTLQALKSKNESTLTFRGDNHPKDISNSSRVQGVNHSLHTRPPILKILFCAVGCNLDTENLPWGQHQTLQRISNRKLTTEAKSLLVRGRQVRCTEGLTDALLSWPGEKELWLPSTLPSIGRWSSNSKGQRHTVDNTSHHKHTNE